MHGDHPLLTRLNDRVDLMPVAGNGDDDGGGHGEPFAWLVGPQYQIGYLKSSS